MCRSIRFKLSVILLIMLLSFIATLLLSFGIFFRDDFRYDIVKEEQNYRNMVSDIAKKAALCGNEKSIKSLLDSYATNNIQLQLLDKNGKRLWATGRFSSVIDISVKDYIVVGGKVQYGLLLNGIIVSRYELFYEYSARYLWIILILFALLFLLIAFFLHLSIAKPVLALYKRMENDPLKLKTEKRNYRRDEIGVLEKRFDETIYRLQAVDREQQTILAAISHDLKTPLTSIITYTERLSLGKVTDYEKQKHYYDVIMQKADDIKNLINKFQDAAQFADLDEHANYQTVFAASFWQSVLEPYTEEWNDVDAKLKFECNIDNNVLIRVDRSSIIRVIANVMGNAVKYGARPLIVHVYLTKHENQIRLKIENNGTQVSDDKLTLLFDRFYRAEPSRSREKGGSGLGLFICREIIEKHGGTICAYKPWDNDFGVEILVPIVNS